MRRLRLNLALPSATPRDWHGNYLLDAWHLHQGHPMIPQTTCRIWRTRTGDTWAYNGKGESTLVYKEPKRGATPLCQKEFKAALKRTPYTDQSDRGFYLMVGMVIGAACAFVLFAAVTFLTWQL